MMREDAHLSLLQRAENCVGKQRRAEARLHVGVDEHVDGATKPQRREPLAADARRLALVNQRRRRMRQRIGNRRGLAVIERLDGSTDDKFLEIRQRGVAEFDDIDRA